MQTLCTASVTHMFMYHLQAAELACQYHSCVYDQHRACASALQTICTVSMIDVFAGHLHGPPSLIALVNQPLVLRTKLLLLPECSQGDQARQRLTELAEDGGQGDGVQAFQLPVSGYI